jgi:hypothetical protein
MVGEGPRELPVPGELADEEEPVAGADVEVDLPDDVADGDPTKDDDKEDDE